MATCSIATLLDQACDNGFRCLDERTFRGVLLQLLCDLQENGGSGGESGLVWGPDPTALDSIELSFPTFGPAETTLSFPTLASVTSQFNASSLPNIQSLSIPLLATVGTNFLVSGTAITALNGPSMISIGGELATASNSSITQILLPVIVTIGGGINAEDDTSLAVFSAPNWAPTNGTSITFINCALNAASVNQILARCVSAGVTTCTINLSNGTSSAPTGQGIIDKADLITAGNTVTTN